MVSSDNDQNIEPELRQLASLDKDEMEEQLKVTLTEELFQAIREGGIAAAAFLLNEVTWEKASKVANRAPVDLVADLNNNPSFLQFLSPAQLYLLKQYQFINDSY